MHHQHKHLTNQSYRLSALLTGVNVTTANRQWIEKYQGCGLKAELMFLLIACVFLDIPYPAHTSPSHLDCNYNYVATIRICQVSRLR